MATRVEQLVRRGVVIPAPTQIFLDDNVRPDRIAAGAILSPGARLLGPRTYVASGAVVGSEGPATLDNAVLGAGAVVASGYVRNAVLLPGAKLGGNAHVRDGTLLEEQASTAHAVGLKNTILLSYVTLGSLINFCDVLMAGGTSRRNHSEVGSGYIHFNFTPWGEHGDKATPSLVGDVVHGVFLDQKRIFLGGNSGMVGPRRVGYGSIAAAGQVLRSDVDPGNLVRDVAQPIRIPVPTPGGKHVERVIAANIAFLAQLVALQHWYREVRLARIPNGAKHADARVVITEAISVIGTCLEDRHKHFAEFLKQHGHPVKPPVLHVVAPCPVKLKREDVDHLAWLDKLAATLRDQLRGWLQHIVDDITLRATRRSPNGRAARITASGRSRRPRSGARHP